MEGIFDKHYIDMDLIRLAEFMFCFVNDLISSSLDCTSSVDIMSQDWLLIGSDFSVNNDTYMGFFGFTNITFNDILAMKVLRS